MAYTPIQIRRDTAANFTSANPTLANGEWALETDTKKMKIGDGSTAWTTLAYNIGATGGTFPAINATTVTSNGALTPSQYTQFDATSGALTITLPTGQAAGTIAVVEKIDATSNTVTFTGNIRDVGSSSLALVGQHETHVLEVDSTGSWFVPASHKPLSVLDTRYAPEGSLHWPFGGYLGGTSTTTLAVNTIYGRRFICQRAGSFTNITIYLGSVASGVHATVGLYDTGDASAGTRTLLGSSASTTLATGSGYQTLQFSATTSVKMGQHVDLAIILDTGTTAAIDSSGVANSNYSLPTTGLASSTAFLACAGGAPPKLAWNYAPGSYTMPSTITESNLSLGTAKPAALFATIQ
ncbi:MAG TPA: hypothetical protein VFA63_13550 [Pseudonocardiaceae bacterium]|nr:hypothetical protein [Pseudonocardiaceae bacterium]